MQFIPWYFLMDTEGRLVASCAPGPGDGYLGACSQEGRYS